MHQWVALTDNSDQAEDVAAITGYLKVSIQVTGVNDKAIQIEVDEKGLQEANEEDIWMPS